MKRTMEAKPKHTLIHVTKYDKKNLEQPKNQDHRNKWLWTTKFVNTVLFFS